MTLTQILAYANVLTEDAFAELADCIEYLNDAQDIIARFKLVQAAPVSYVLTSNLVTLPVDFLKFHKATLDDIPYTPPNEPWAGVLTLETELTEGTLKLWYYKKPAVLLSSTPSQVPEVDSAFHRAMASYAARMFNLVDDDPALREAFSNEFYNSLAAMKMDSGFTFQYKNF